MLLQKRYEVVHLSRRANPFVQAKAFKWNIEKGTIDDAAFEGITGIVHLAGEGIADARWTAKRKQQVIDSRVKSTSLLFDALQRNHVRPEVFVGASAVGFYGAVTTEKIFREDDAPAEDFLGSCCALWEQSYVPFIDSGIRTAIIRVGVVLSPDGGALKKMADPIRKGFGSALGSGKQFVPWIHEEDIRGIFFKALEDESMSGIFNAVAPEHATNAQLTQLIAAQLNKKIWLPPVPSFVLRLLFGEMADMILRGSRVNPEKIIKAGYAFQFPLLQDALKNLMEKKRTVRMPR